MRGRSLTVDVEADGVLGVLNAVHDLTAVGARVTGAQLDHGERGVAHVLRVAGHGHAVAVAGADLDEAVLGHQHCGLHLAHHLGPLDAQVVPVEDGVAVGADEGRGGGEGGEEARQGDLPREGAAHRLTDGQWVGSWRGKGGVNDGTSATFTTCVGLCVMFIHDM